MIWWRGGRKGKNNKKGICIKNIRKRVFVSAIIKKRKEKEIGPRTTTPAFFSLIQPPHLPPPVLGVLRLGVVMPLGVENKNDFALDKWTKQPGLAKWFRRLYKLVLLDVFLSWRVVPALVVWSEHTGRYSDCYKLYKTRLKSRYCPSRICGIFRVWVHKIQLDGLDNQPTVLPILLDVCLYLTDPAAR